MRPTARSVSLLALLSTALLIAGCSSGGKATSRPLSDGTLPDYSRQLRPGEVALRKITDPARMPDIGAAFRSRDTMLLAALDRSQRWFQKPSSKTWFPMLGIEHRQAHASVLAFEELLEVSRDESEFLSSVHRKFDVYESVGYDGDGIVLFTGYYAGRFDASPTRTSEFRYPLYTRPADLVTDPKTGAPKGRRTDRGDVVPYHTRRDIEDSQMFAGNEVAWLEDPLSAYIIHINGSARLDMTDGSVMYVGYNGKTDRSYKGLGQALLEEKVLTRGELSLRRIKQLYREDPAVIEDMILRNDNYVFFTEYPEGTWPAGSLGVRVTAETSLATDKRIYPRGGVVMVDTQAVTFSQGRRDFTRFMLDQDTGGAINAPGRADIYMGNGLAAEILAGGQYAEGRLYYLFVKPEYVSDYAPEADRIRRADAR